MTTLLESKGRRKDALVIVLLLALLNLGVFFPLFRFGFINLDDPAYVTENPGVKGGLTLKNIGWAFRTDYAGNWHPLTWLSHMVDCQVFGLQAGGHHFTNVFFHTLNTLLLFLVLKRMTARLWPSAMVAALFAFHPLHVESVAWVSERKDVLSTFFFMLTLWAYARYVEIKIQDPTSNIQKGEATGIQGQVSFNRQSGSRFFYVLSLGFFALGLMSKPMLVTLPFVLLLLDYWPLRRLTLAVGGSDLVNLMRLLREKLPFFALSFVSCVITYIVQQRGGAVVQTATLPIWMRGTNAIMSYALYVRKMFLPLDLAVFYPYYGTFSPATIAVAVLLLGAVTVQVMRKAGTKRYLAVGWFWYVGMLVPVIGLVQVGSQSMADRYTYLPLIGLFIMLVWAIADLVGARNYRRPLVFLAGASVVAVCIAATVFHLRFWRDRERLFTHALAVTRDNAMAHFLIASMFGEQKKYDQAIEHFSKVLQIKPGRVDTHYNLAHIYTQLGRKEEAKKHYEEELRYHPEHALAHNNLAVLLTEAGKLEEAVAHYAEASRLEPTFPSAHLNLGKVLADKGNFGGAVTEYAAALRLGGPNWAEAHTGLGLALAMQGDFSNALVHLEEAVRLRPTNAEANLNLANVLEDAGQSPKAGLHYGQALKLQPDLVNAHLKLAQTAASQTNIAGEISHLTMASRLDPDNTEVHEKLALLLASRGELNEAIKHFRQVVGRRKDAPSHHNLGVALNMQGDYRGAISEYRAALELQPERVEALNDLAWLLATAPAAEVRDGAEAIKLASRACDLTERKEARFLGTLDAAYAEAGRFDDAIRVAERARELASAAGQNELVQAAANRLKLYEAGKPFREEVAKNKPSK